ncbi:MAG: TMEM165/GDT1 family protein [Methanothrix sp.]|nr:TMEM165/GDT1 family protein [Methanothrix sp.]
MEGANIIETLNEILIPLVAVGLAEMGDKTQLSVLLLSSRTKDYIQLLLGVMLAFLLADGFAILVGSWVTSVVPIHLVKLISGTLFILFGILILKGDRDEGDRGNLSPKNAFVSGFSMIFLSEWGDKTQIASSLFATEYDPRMVFIGVMTALLMLSIMAIWLGRFLSGRVDRKVITKVAGAVFLLIGLSFLLSALTSSAFADII